MVAVPAALGVSLATPKEYSPTLSVLLAMLGAASGIYGLMLAREGQIEAALVADTASIMFDLLSIAKALELI